MAEHEGRPLEALDEAACDDPQHTRVPGLAGCYEHRHVGIELGADLGFSGNEKPPLDLLPARIERLKARRKRLGFLLFAREQKTRCEHGFAEPPGGVEAWAEHIGEMPALAHRLEPGTGGKGRKPRALAARCHLEPLAHEGAVDRIEGTTSHTVPSATRSSRLNRSGPVYRAPRRRSSRAVAASTMKVTPTAARFPSGLF